MRTSDQKLSNSLKTQITKTLSQTVSDLDGFEETHKFFSDFFNDSEFETFAKRLAVAYWLKKGRSYANIKQNLKVSSATIASIQNDMNKTGFKLALKKLEAEEWASQWSEKIRKFVRK